MNPINDVSETHDKFKPNRRIHEFYGPPTLHISQRHVVSCKIFIKIHTRGFFHSTSGRTYYSLLIEFNCILLIQFVPQYKDFVYPFYKDRIHSVIRMSHPYLTTNEYFHRYFFQDELDHYEMLDAITASSQVCEREYFKFFIMS